MGFTQSKVGRQPVMSHQRGDLVPRFASADDEKRSDQLLGIEPCLPDQRPYGGACPEPAWPFRAGVLTLGIARVTAAASCSTPAASASATTWKPASRATADVRGPIVIAGRLVGPPSFMKPRTADPEANTTAAISG